MRAADLVEAGQTETKAITNAVYAEIDSGLEVEYVALAGQDLVQPLTKLDRPGFLAVAAWSGGTRLIDSIHFDVQDRGFVADRGSHLEEESVLYARGAG
jgi:pantothenate synthetase